MMINFLVERRDDLLKEKRTAHSSVSKRLQQSVERTEDSILQNLHYDADRQIEEARNGDKTITDDFTLIIDRIQSRKDTLITLIADARVLGEFDGFD